LRCPQQQPHFVPSTFDEKNVWRLTNSERN
jgi:hypothetical protein